MLSFLFPKCTVSLAFPPGHDVLALTRLRCQSSIQVQHESLQQSIDTLDSVPCIAVLSAMRVLSVLVDWRHFASANQLVRFVGLDVQETTSGTSVQGEPHISKRGSALLRKWLYMCALGLLDHDGDFRRWADELRARGKTGKVVVVAVMRKLLRILSGVWKSGQPYDPRKAFPGHYAQPMSGAQQAAC